MHDVTSFVNRTPFEMFYTPFVYSFIISCSYTRSSFTNILPFNWFGLSYSLILSLAKISHVDTVLRSYMCHIAIRIQICFSSAGKLKQVHDKYVSIVSI